MAPIRHFLPKYLPFSWFFLITLPMVLQSELLQRVKLVYTMKFVFLLYDIKITWVFKINLKKNVFVIFLVFIKICKVVFTAWYFPLLYLPANPDQNNCSVLEKIIQSSNIHFSQQITAVNKEMCFEGVSNITSLNPDDFRSTTIMYRLHYSSIQWLSSTTSHHILLKSVQIEAYI